jgi:hypothetical protein
MTFSAFIKDREIGQNTRRVQKKVELFFDAVPASPYMPPQVPLRSESDPQN